MLQYDMDKVPTLEVICILGTFATRVPPVYWYLNKHFAKDIAFDGTSDVSLLSFLVTNYMVI